MDEAGGDLAGYGSRVGATLLDGLLVGVVAFLAVVVTGVTRGDVNYVVIALALLSSLLFEVPGGSTQWWALYPRFAELPASVLAAAAALFGVAVGWAGWKAGSRPAPAQEAAAM